MKILIVEDKVDHLYMLEALLKGNGYEVVSAANGKEALKRLRSEGADMIISDILMPVMDGFQLCQKVRADETLKYTPFVFYTATYTDEKDEEFALKIGADKFLRKPMEPDEFIKIIQGLVRDVEEGKLRPQEPALGKTEEIFELYSERLVKKLEKKMLDLEKEIDERERAEERIKHLNLVLSAIRKVNQLIIGEKDPDRLLQGVCDSLIENRGYYNAWIALLDDTGRSVATAEAGLGKDFLPIVEQLKSGKMTDCVKKAQVQSDIVVTQEPLSTCPDCPLAKRYPGRAGFTARLEHDEKMYGLLTVSIPGDFAADEEEQSLFRGIAGDIGYALYNMELEEERKRAEYDLGERMKELQTLYGIANIAERPGITLDEVYQEVANVLPSGWQYPEISCSRITINDKEFRTSNYRETEWKQSSDIRVNQAKVGTVEVCYLEERPGLDEGPFSKEERLLIDAVSERLGRITERRQAEEELEKHRDHLEEMVRERTTELQSIINAMSGREVRMAELKEVIRKLRAQIDSAGLTPVADDPLKEI